MFLSTRIRWQSVTQSIRRISITTPRFGKSIENRSILIQPITQQIKDHHQHKIRTSETYQQLPDDSQFITQHYDELIKFRKYLNSNFHKNYKDYKDSNDLIKDLSNFINFQLKTEIWKFNLPIELEIEFFEKFLHNLKICLKLNGGHPFILDILLLNKECFDQVEKKIEKK